MFSYHEAVAWFRDNEVRLHERFIVSLQSQVDDGRQQPYPPSEGPPPHWSGQHNPMPHEPGSGAETALPPEIRSEFARTERGHSGTGSFAGRPLGHKRNSSSGGMVTLQLPRGPSQSDAASVAGGGGPEGSGGVGGVASMHHRNMNIGSEDFAVCSPQGSWGGSAEGAATATAAGGGGGLSTRFSANAATQAAGVAPFAVQSAEPGRVLWPEDVVGHAGDDDDGAAGGGFRDLLYDAAGFETMQQGMQQDYRELVRQARASDATGNTTD